MEVKNKLLNTLLLFKLAILAIPVVGIAQHQKPTKDFLPDFYAVQYAGSIGLASVGTGWDLFHNQVRLSTHFGHLPRAQGGELNTISLKMMFPGFQRNYKNVEFRFLQSGFMVSYVTGDDFSTRWSSERYPKGYYWWSTAWRSYLIFEHSITFNVKSNRIENVGIYLENNVMDLYMISWILNTRAIKPGDIIKLGIGVRVGLK